MRVRQHLGRQFKVSSQTIWRILKKNKFKWVKHIVKPRLIFEIRKKHLEWCLEHEHWTLDDWRKVIWSDETSVVLGHRHGANCAWRRTWERYDGTVIRRRHKKAAEFMFRGS